MGEDDLGIFPGFKGQKSNAFGEFVEDVFLDDTMDELMDLFRTAINFWKGNVRSTAWIEDARLDRSRYEGLTGSALNN